MTDLYLGGPATLVYHTDRKAATIVKLTPWYVTVQEDKATRTDSNGMSDSQSYRYDKNPDGRTHRFHKATMKRGGVRLVLGVRDHYHDYSF